MPPIIPPDFLTQHHLYHRLYLRPLTGLTPAQPWAPLTDAEWAALAPLLAAMGCGLRDTARPGRPIADVRGRLDAIFRAVTTKRPQGGRAPWHWLPEGFGKPDTVSRSYRRWAQAGLWARLLVEAALPGAPPALRAILHRLCCAYRRAIRWMGLRALVLARRLGLYSALPAPSAWLPDPDLSALVWPLFQRLLSRLEAQPGWEPPRGLFRALSGLLALAGGRQRVPLSAEPA